MRQARHVVVLGLGVLAMAIMLSRAFGKFLPGPWVSASWGALVSDGVDFAVVAMKGILPGIAALVVVLGCGGLASSNGEAGVDGGALEGLGDSASCTSGAACGPGCSGRCLITLASDQAFPFGIAVDGTSVYWTNAGSAVTPGSPRGVLKIPLRGGSPTTLSHAPSGSPSSIAIDAMSAFWVEGAYNLVKESLGGGAAVTLTTTGNFLGDIAEDASGVYLVENWNFEGQTGGFGVWKVAINGGPPATVASAGSMGPSFPSAQGIAVDATNIYWTDQGVDSPGAGRVMKVGRTGGKPTTLASGSGAPGEIAVDGTSAYWTNSNGLVMKIALVGGTSTTLASDQKSPGALAVDTANVYWVASGAIMKVALGGGSPTTLASGQDGPTRIAVDATSVYWTNAGSRTPQAGVTGTVMRLTPK